MLRTTALFAIRWYAFRVDDSVSVLAADRSAEHILRAVRLNGMQNFCLLIADGVGLKRNRRLHRGEADELHDVIRHHVAQGAGVVVITAALLNAHSFCDRNLYVIDVTADAGRLGGSGH